ncbi:protein SFI1 homolog isoform X5 [Nycticebus coucang]|uniref:protein SFI1 homolog isoform X5 n=1 Tax=Nycticebus coucang TaxID=9470 RepID=UPI00234D6CA0|nr:protein SFI1 homolog isoform X5 [Nycticebus coucang]
MKNLITKKSLSSHWLNFHEKVIKQRMEKKVDFRSFRDGASQSLQDGALKKPYSPKILSKKKPSVFCGIRRKVPGANLPVQSHASRTWTRQGRLKELHIRCVARKFLYLWIRMTFGRVFPSKARSYYEQQILQKVFDKWKEEWWVSHHEWKLCVRADCHYRYYLYNLMFQTWKTYMHQQQEMRNKYIRAVGHYVKQKMRQAWKSWLIYVVVRRTKLQMQGTALEFRQRSILRMWWSEWRRQLGQVQESHALHASAVKHRALSLQLRGWSQWREQLLHKQTEKEKVISAGKHHQHWQKRRVLQAWLEYLQVRRKKKQQNEMAERFYHVTVLQIHFSGWQWAWEQRESLYAHHARVEDLARRMVLRRAFVHWKHYMLLCAEEAARCSMAEEHYQLTLLHFCFRALKHNVTRAHLHRIRRNLAHQQHGVMLTRRFWNLWQFRIEQREEIAHLPLLRAAWNHYRITLLCKSVRLWSQYTRRRRDKQLLQARADGHFQQRALPAAFHTWNRLWRWSQQESVLNARAARFHRVTLEKQMFAIWWQKMFLHRENRLAERMAILHAERQLLHRFWSTWCQQAAAYHQERERRAVACAHHRHRQLRSAFCIWRETAQGLRTERMGRVQATEFYSAQLLRWAWNRWRECLALCGLERRKLQLADLHHQHRLLHRALLTWVTYRDRVRHVLREVAARENWHNRQLLRGVLHRWRGNTVARVDEARKTSQARAHYRRTLCSKVLVQWQENASVQIYYRQQEDCAVREARKMLDRGCLRTWFRCWWDRSQRSAQQRVKLERAARYHHQQLLLKGVAQWKTHHLGCVRKRLLQQQGTHFLAHRLLRACFHQWIQQLATRRQEQQATARALWFWAFSLQAKVWAAWLGFVLERRRKKARLEQAVQAYRGQLLREGATRLLRFATATKAFRQQLQAQQQVKAAHTLHRAVRHCATLWKQKVLGCGGKSQPPAPVAASRRVTFEGPLLDQAIAGAGDATLESKRPRALQPQEALGSLATGEPHLQELPGQPEGTDPVIPPSSAARSARKQPRRPHFLLEPMQSQWSLGCGTLGRQGGEMLQECGLSMTKAAKAALTEASKAPAPSSLLPGAMSSAPSPKLTPTASTGSELLLLPPSSFMPRGVEAAARVSAQPTTPRLKPQAPRLLPGDFRDTKARPGSEAAGCLDLEAELEGIQQQLQHYQATKQNLRSCQRQASSLRRWLELSREEPRPEDQEMELRVQEELEEVRPRPASGTTPPLAVSPLSPDYPMPGGAADPAADQGAPGAAPAHQLLRWPHPGPAAHPVLVSLPLALSRSRLQSHTGF